MDRKYSARINRLIETWFPPAFVDTQTFARIMNYAQGRGFRLLDLDSEVPDQTRANRDRDYSLSQAEFVLHQVAGQSVLELGCGDGLLLRELQKQGLSVLGVDPLSTAQGVEVRRKRFEDCHFPDDSWETVIAVHTLEHLTDARSVLRDMRRVASKRVIVIVPCQRYRRYTYDGHINFYPDERQLKLQLNVERFDRLQKIDLDWCFTLLKRSA